MLLTGFERAWIVVPLALALPAGCAAWQWGPATAGHDDPGPGSETSPLAEQARRDIEQLRQLREQSEAEAPARETAALVEAQTLRKPPQIQWTRPRSAANRTDHYPAAAKNQTRLLFAGIKSDLDSVE